MDKEGGTNHDVADAFGVNVGVAALSRNCHKEEAQLKGLRPSKRTQSLIN